MVNKNRLINLVNDINTTRKDLSKMQTNLPARLMQININNHKRKHSNKHKLTGKPRVYAKSVSSTFSSVMHNNHTHTQGKTIVNESNKPYIKIDEIHNGDVQHYMIPKNSIPYKPNKKLAMQIKLLPQHPTMQHHPTMAHHPTMQQPTMQYRHIIPTMQHSTKTRHHKKHNTKQRHTKSCNTKKLHTKKLHYKLSY